MNKRGQIEHGAKHLFSDSCLFCFHSLPLAIRSLLSIQKLHRASSLGYYNPPFPSPFPNLLLVHSVTLTLFILRCGLLELHDYTQTEEKKSQRLTLSTAGMKGGRKLEEEGKKLERSLYVLALIKSPFSEMYASRALASSTPVWATMS